MFINPLLFFTQTRTLSSGKRQMPIYFGYPENKYIIMEVPEGYAENPFQNQSNYGRKMQVCLYLMF
jgi:hypothetical protein